MSQHPADPNTVVGKLIRSIFVVVPPMSAAIRDRAAMRTGCDCCDCVSLRVKIKQAKQLDGKFLLWQRGRFQLEPLTLPESAILIRSQLGGSESDECLEFAQNVCELTGDAILFRQDLPPHISAALDQGHAETRDQIERVRLLWWLHRELDAIVVDRVRVSDLPGITRPIVFNDSLRFEMAKRANQIANHLQLQRK